MSRKTKLIGAGAVALAVVIAVVLISRGDDTGSSEPAATPVAETPEEAANRTGREAALSDAGPAVQLLPDGGAPPAPAPAHVSRFPLPPNPAAYRPARYLAWSEDEVSLDPSKDNSSWALRRMIEITQASPRQADLIRGFWKKHEDGRRELWNKTPDRRSGPRILDQEALHGLDATFETDLLGQVLDEDQGQRMLLEVAPKGSAPQVPRAWTPEERAQQMQERMQSP